MNGKKTRNKKRRRRVKEIILEEQTITNVIKTGKPPLINESEINIGM